MDWWEVPAGVGSLDKATSGEKEHRTSRFVGSTGDMGRGGRKAAAGNLLQS